MIKWIKSFFEQSEEEKSAVLMVETYCKNCTSTQENYVPRGFEVREVKSSIRDEYRVQITDVSGEYSYIECNNCDSNWLRIINRESMN